MTLPIRDFIIQRLLEFDPNFDVGSGVPTTGLMIDPLSVIMQPIVDELTAVQASKSILTILESSNPDAFPEDIVDGLASNVFIERNPGSIGSTVVRIRFFSPQDFAAQRGVLIWRGPAGQRFTNSEAVSITRAEMALSQEGALYFVDVPVIALEEGSAFNVPAGSITTMEAEPVGVANVTNLFKVDQGRDRETNTELIDRIKVAVTVRALVTGRGIVVTLTENFTTIEEIEPIGFGDPEMMRDIVYNVHIGGNVDVYIKTAAFSSGFKDIFGIEVDTTRHRAASASVSLIEQDVLYSLGHGNLDRTDGNPVVTPIDNTNLPYTEGVDYDLNDATGTIFRPTGSAIFHLVAAAAAVTDAKTLTQSGGFVGVRPGMTLTISTPESVAGTYTIKENLNNDAATIYGEFPVSSAANVDYTVDDTLLVTFAYNPVSIDIIKSVRSTNRTDFTITDVPVMYIESIEVLDPLSGDPTGDLLSGDGGLGSGGFGEGGFGEGSGVDFQLIIEKPTLRHSWLEDNYLDFKEILVGTSVRVNYWYASGIPPIQAFMDDRDQQSETASLVARHFIPVFVDSNIPITYDIRAGTQATAISVEDMTELVKEAIDDVDEGNPLEIADLIDLLYDNGAVRVDLSIAKNLRGEIHNHDGSVVFTLPTESGNLEIPDNEIPDPTDAPLSPRIARFRARNITLTRNVVP